MLLSRLILSMCLIQSETKDVYGVTFEQGRNELIINDELFANVVTENKEIPESCKD